MNTKLIVKISADSNFIPIKYSVIAMIPRVTPITGAADVMCVLEVIRVGWDTSLNYNNYKDYRKMDGAQGVMGTFSVAALSTVEVYHEELQPIGYDT